MRNSTLLPFGHFAQISSRSAFALLGFPSHSPAIIILDRNEFGFSLTSISQLSEVFLKNFLNLSISDVLVGLRLHHAKSWANNLIVGFRPLIAGRKSLKVSYHARCSSL